MNIERVLRSWGLLEPGSKESNGAESLERSMIQASFELDRWVGMQLAILECLQRLSLGSKGSRPGSASTFYREPMIRLCRR